MTHHELEIRIPYADVDQMGVVYYANYLVYFERGRTELMRAIGMQYKDIERDYQLYLPVVDVHIKYLAPAKYDDIIIVRTKVDELRKASMIFSYEIHNKQGQLLIQGSSTHVFINSSWKPSRAPEELINKMKVSHS
jgi:acyl-CoA thioester hydrolase